MNSLYDVRAEFDDLTSIKLPIQDTLIKFSICEGGKQVYTEAQIKEMAYLASAYFEISEIDKAIIIFEEILLHSISNDNNFYALYLYRMVNIYKDYVKLWEVWNEPDLDYAGNGWKPSGLAGNWWDADPNPCDVALRAPVQHYIRMLRISYEVIKTLDPAAYVTVGGLGYASYYDAILRNTDNPFDGSITPDYPYRGGAYFDVLSFHSYPHLDESMRKWNNNTGTFDYFRHSDQAAQGFIDKKDKFLGVSQSYGYNNINYPEKLLISTETNIPSKRFGEYIGSDTAQLNYVMKTIVHSYKHDIRHREQISIGHPDAHHLDYCMLHCVIRFDRLLNAQIYCLQYGKLNR